MKTNTNAKVTSVEEDSLNIDSKSKVKFRKKYDIDKAKLNLEIVLL